MEHELGSQSGGGSWGTFAPQAPRFGGSAFGAFKPKLRGAAPPRADESLVEAVPSEAGEAEPNTDGEQTADGGKAVKATPTEGAEKDRKSSEEIEEAAYKALLKAKASKKAAKNALKRPAAVLKKPVGPDGYVLKITYKIAWEEGDEERSKNVFECRHYGRAKTELKNKFPKAKPEDVQATLRDVTARARALYLKKVSGE